MEEKNGTECLHSAVWWDAEAVCPFYHRVRKQSREIVCEAVTPQAAVSALRFHSGRAMEAYLASLCSDLEGCRRCPGYRAASLKYDETGSLRRDGA